MSPDERDKMIATLRRMRPDLSPEVAEEVTRRVESEDIEDAMRAIGFVIGAILERFMKKKP